MESKTYAEKLKDPRWKQKRMEILQRDEFRCRECRHDDLPLNVHHIIYLKEAEPWEYDNNYLITLCEECHKIEHQFDNADIPYQIAHTLVKLTNLQLSKLQYVLYNLPDWGIKDKKNRREILIESYMELLNFMDLT